MRTAALWEEWAEDDDVGDDASPAIGGTEPVAAQFPAAPLNVRVELFLDTDWVDLTAGGYVYTRDPIAITRGEPNEGSGVEVSRCTMTINNRDGRFSPRNPRSPYFGLLGRNTPLRVTIFDVGPAHDSQARFYGEVSSWPPQWTTGGHDVWVSIEAAGILRRLDARNTPAKSALLRGIPATDPDAYWPLEGDSATDDLVSGRTLVQSGQVQYGANADNPASGPLPDFTGGGSLVSVLPATGTTSAWRIEFVARFGTGSNTVQEADFTIPVRVTCPAGTVNIWEFLISGGTAILQWADTAGAFTGLADSTVAVDDGQWHHLRAEVSQSGSDVAVKFWVDGTLTNSTTLVGRTLDSTRSRVGINPDRENASYVGSVGHLTYWAPYSSTADTAVFAAAHDGETAAARMARLCAEEDVPFILINDSGSTTRACGPQYVAALLDLLKDAAAVDGGLLYEPRDALGLAYRPLRDQYNQDPALALDYGNGEVAPPLEPQDDDQQTRNDMTVTRRFGGSGQVVQETGDLSIQPPPQGVGRYNDSAEVGAHSDDDAGDLASWLVHLGTIDEARWPRISVNLARLGADGKAGLLADAARMDLGSRVTIDNPPDWLSQRPIDQIARGYTETLAPFGWDLTHNCAPAAALRIATLEASDPLYTARLQTAGSTLVGDYSASATALTVASSGARWVDSATYAASFPFDVEIQGIRMTVTAISGTSSPQVFTVTRSTDGFDMPLRDSAQVRLWNRTYIGL